MKNTTLVRTVPPLLRVGKFSKTTTYIMYFIAICLVIPIIDVPLVGLSLTAPLFFLIAAEAVIKPPKPWSIINRRYIILPILVWAGIFLSMTVNGLASGGVDINSYGIATVIRYAYWLFIYVLTAYVISAGKLADVVSRVLGWSILGLVFLRWGEVLVYGNIGAWTGTRLFLQNTYGILFSIFSPFLLIMVFSKRKWESHIAILGNIILWGAVAINGSRGSWVSVSISVILLFLMIFFSQPRKGVGGVFLLIIIAIIAFFAFSASTPIFQAVESRMNTFQNLNEEKSYMIRQLMNQKALRLFEQSPFFGVGAGRFRVTFIPLEIPHVLSYAGQSYFNAKTSHNSYLGFLAENGLFGAVPFGILLALLVVMGLKSALSLARQEQYWGIAIYSSFIGMSVHLWAFSSLTNTATWFIYGLVTGMIIHAQTEIKENK